MKSERLLHFVAPCSMLCYTCLGLKDGAFSECAPRLNAYTEGVCEFLIKTHGSHMSEEERVKHYSFFNEFHDALKQLSGGLCHGCRSDISLKRGCFEDCVIPNCAKNQEVDFCAECDEFPCQKAKELFLKNGGSSQKWEDGNNRITEIGIEAYFEEMKSVSHYKSYKTNAE